MLVDTLFYIVFFGQIVLISFVFPRKINRNIRYVLDNYSAKNYPKLYPLPYEHYEKQYKYFVLLCRGILLIGIILLGLFISGKFGRDMQTTIPLGYFFVQYIPLMLIEILGNKQFKLMRGDESRKTRKQYYNHADCWISYFRAWG